MPQKRFFLGWLLILLCWMMPSVAGAGALVFSDPSAGSVEVYSLDWIPGNSLADEALPLGTDPNNPTRFTQTYQASLGNFLNSAGNVITGTGLNVSYEITIVSSYGQIGVRSPLDPDNDGFVEIENSNFDLDASSNVNFVEIYLDPNRNSNALTGAGYRDGILLMKGIVSAATGQFSAYLDMDGNNILDLKALDQFLTNNYPGTGTISGTGSAQLTVAIDSASVNPTYFPGVGSSPLTLFFNTSLVLPYYQQNPSASVVGVVPELGAASGGYSRVNGLAALDSTDRIDMLFQADANSSISLGPCIDIVKEVSVDGGLTWFDANTLEDSPGTTDGAIYRFIVSNCSSVTLTDVTVTDPNLGENGLPLIINLGTLAPDASVTVDPAGSFGSPLLEKPLLCADVPPPGNEDPIKFNLASVVGTVIGTNTTVEDSDPAYVRCLCVDIEKLVSVDGGATFVDADQCFDPAAPIATGAVEYQLVVSNCGAAVLDDVRVIDSLLGIDQLVGTLMPEQVVTYDKETLPGLLHPDFCALFGSDAEGSRDIDNTATVTATAFNRLFDLSDEDSACVTCLCSGSIGDFVWNDLNRNGIQDAGEPGIFGVIVNLLMGDQTVATTTTDANGFYEFTGLCAGDYVVTVVTPDGYMPSPSFQGGDMTVDSNGSPANVTLFTDNSSDPTIDFGFYAPCTGSIGDFVWNDLNRNGIQDVGEPGISAVTVNLLQGGGVIATTMTDGNGFYQFNDLCSGTYAVTVATPDGYTVSPSLQGGDMAADSNGSPATVTLTTDNSSDPTVDFGFYLMDAQIGDFIWLDENRNGIQDAGEAGLPGVTVNLLDCDGNVIETTATDGSGYYSFTVEPGDYKVQFVLPGGYAFSPMDQGGDDAKDSDADSASGTTACTTLEPGENDPTWDAGMYLMCDGVIGNYVWIDADQDGLQDEGEMPLSGVIVNLLMGNTSVGSTTTDSNGFYQFIGLCPGDYVVSVVTPMDYLPTPVCSNDPTVDGDANCNNQPVTSNNDSNNTIDFGFYVMPASIGDFVWNDTNKNGVQDAGEMGIVNVTVKLYNCTTDELVATTTTDASGAYSFTGLMPGSYRVEFTAPTGYAFTMPNVGDDALDSDANASGVTECVTLIAGENNTTVDAGLYVMPASLGDYVWNDTNKNGVQDAGEMGIPNVTVNLYDCLTDALVATTTTDADGLYSFTGLMPGSYRVEFVAPMGYAFTMQNVGDDATDSDANASGVTDCVTLIAGETNTTVDAGLYLMPASLGDYVWNDTNKNGVQDAGEMGIAGVTVNLYDCLTDALVATTTTDASGAYSFTGLMPGSYRVEFTAPTGYAFTMPNVGDDALDSDANASGVTECVTLIAGENNTTVDAGLYVMPASLGDYVWNDTNKNGVQDAGEMGITGVTVNLYDCLTDALVATTVTDADGKYLFENLMPGSYRVEFVAPMGYAFTMSNQGGNDALDSDANASGVTECVTLAAGETNTTVDAGLYALVPAIDIEKYTNGEDADEPTGPMVVIGSPINWTYVVTNTGEVTLTNVLVVDDKGVAVTCPAATLAVGESMTCTANGTAMEGQYANIGTATGDYGVMSVTDSDPSHYYGVSPDIHLTKDVSVDGGMTWFEADNITQCSDPNVPNVEVCTDYSDCGPCEGKVTSLTLAYRGTGSAKIKITNRDGYELFKQDVVNPGQQMTFTLADGYGKLTTEIKIYVNGSFNTSIHTSCSQPVGPGLISGSFEVIAGKSLYGGNLCPINHDAVTAECGECEGKVNNLTLAYRGATKANIKITNKDGYELFRQDNVIPNQQFTFALKDRYGRLTTDIKIYVNWSLNTAIHTSCSQPIGPGLVKGSFEVIAGTSLYGGNLCPINGTTPDPGTCTPDEVMYRFTITNTGGVTLNNLALTDSLYDISAIAPDCMLPETLAPGQSYTCSSNSLPTQMGLITNTATATGDYAGVTVTDSNDASYCGPYEPVPAIAIEKYTNGEDADTPTGPMVAIGSPIAWTYVVTNTGNVTLNDVTVVDNQGVAVSCPATTLQAGEVMTCTGNGTAVAGQYANLGTAKGFYNGMPVTDSDPSHYYATPPAIDVEKFVSTDGVNWFDADQAPGIEVAVCPDLSCDAGSEYDCQEQKDYYWKEYERTKYEHDSKKNAYEKKKSDRDRSKSDHDKSKYTRDSSKKDCDGKQKAYESAKAKYDSSKSYSDKKKMNQAKSEYDYAKAECDRKDADYSSKKSDYDSKKSDCDRSKSEYDKAKSDHSKAKSNWEKHKDRDCSKPSDPNCGTSDCQSSVYFKFVVTNTGTMALSDLALEDSDYETTSCVIPASLAPGENYECVIGPQEAVVGQHTNTATATGTYMGATVTDTDDANYFGKAPCTPKGTGTPGYWMNHPSAWPVDSIVIGGVTYSKTKAIELMKAPTKTDKLYTMFQALVAAKLNVLTCNESSCIDATILAADNWMKTYGPVGKGVSGSSSAWALGEPLYHLLDEYNNGLLCAPSRDTMDRDDEKDKKGTSTQSHWKNKDKSWPISSLYVGGKSYSKDEATWRMSRASNKDVTYTMYRALAAAKLNVRKGNDSSCISDTIKYADEWMEKNSLGKGLTTSSSSWRSAEPYFQRLDEYNNGKLCSSYCDSVTNTSTTTTWSSWSW